MTFATLNSRAGIPLAYANRHGLITGQTGTGKTVSLMRLAESFSSQGVPVFISDVKGDIGALSRSCPSTFLDPFGERGSPLRVPIHAMGADLMSRALELSDTQAACVEIAFAYAQAGARQLDTIADFRRLLVDIEDDSDYVSAHYGRVSTASVGVVMRALLRLEAQGGNAFFGAPGFDVAELLASDGASGRVSILQAERLINSPRIYAAFLLFLLSDLWERLPEVGDLAKPRLVLFFDESHLLFSEINPALLRKIEQTVRLIRSKGVGVYFVTQSAADVPPNVREQLAFRVEHSRDHGVGRASFGGIDENGRPMASGVIAVDLPVCPLGALQEEERPEVPDKPETRATGEGWAKLGLPEILLLIVCLAALCAAGFSLYWYWGTSGLAVAGIVLAGMLKFGR